MRLFSFLLLGIISTPSLMPAAEWHVAQSSAQATGDGSAKSPFLTIAEGVAAASAGDTVTVHAGVWRESVVLPRSGEPGQPIVNGLVFQLCTCAG